MGKEIVYCETCGNRITEEDFEKNEAMNLGNKNYCPKCKDQGLKDYNPAYEELESQLDEPEPASGLPGSKFKQTKSFKTSEIMRQSGGRKMSRHSHHGRASTMGRFAQQGKRPAAQPQGKKSNKTLFIILAVVAIIIIIIIIATAGK